MPIAGGLVLVALLGQAATVGTLGNLERVTIEETTAFSPEQIKDGLSLNTEFRLAARADAPLGDFLVALERTIKAGYRSMGFAEVKVAVELQSASQAIVARVNEGPRYLADEICVRGAKSIPATRLIERLTTLCPPNDAVGQSISQCEGQESVDWVDRDGGPLPVGLPVWCRGQPAPFLTMPEAGSPLHRDVADALADLGWFFPRFAIDVVRQTTGAKARLVIDIADEGPQAVLGRVDVSGNSINSQAEILKCVAIPPGAAATRDEQIRALRQLWLSGRFLKIQVALSRPAAPGEAAALCIQVVEVPCATPLGKPLTKEEACLLKCGRWLAHPERWDGDLVLQSSAGESTAALVFSPGQGVLAWIKYAAAAGQNPIEYATAFSPGEIGLYSISGGRKLLTAPSPDANLLAAFALKVDPNPKDKGKPAHSVAFGCGLNRMSERRESQLPMELSLMFQPAFFMDMAHRYEGRWSYQDGVMVLSTAAETVRFDTASGRLLEYRQICRDDKAGAAAAAPARKVVNAATATERPPTVMRFSFLPGEFRRRVKAIHDATAKHPNSYDPRRPLGSLLTFACDEDLLWQSLGTAEGRKIRSVLRLLLERQFCPPWDDLVLKYYGMMDGGGVFRIPEPVGIYPDKTGSELAKWLWTAALYAGRELSCRGEWPEILGREAFLAGLRNRNAPFAELQEVYRSERAGPLCFLLGSAMLLFADHPSLAELMALRGQQRLSLEDFRKDYRIFLDRRLLIGKSARQMVALLRELDDAETGRLGSLLPPEFAGPFQQWARNLRHDRTQSVDQAMAALLDTLWQGGLRASVNKWLEGWQTNSTTYARQGDSDKIIADATQAIAFDPACAEPYCTRGYAYQGKGDGGRAMADLNEAIRLNPSDGQARYCRAQARSAKKDLDGAIADYSEGIRRKPANLDLYYFGRAFAYDGKGELNNAIADYTEAIRIKPKDPRARRNRAMVYCRKGDFDKAAVDFSEVIRLDPTDGKAYRCLAAAHLQKGDFDKALAEYSEIIRLDPKDSDVYSCRAEAYSCRAVIYLKRGDPGKAIADSTEALWLSPYENRAYVFRAIAYWSKGDMERAIADFTEAIRRKPPDVDRLYCFRGQAYQQKGDFVAALADYNKAIQIDPNCSEAAGRRDVLRAGRAGHHATTAVQGTSAFGTPAAPKQSWPGNSPSPYSADPSTQGKDPQAEDDFSDVKKFGAGLK